MKSIASSSGSQGNVGYAGDDERERNVQMRQIIELSSDDESESLVGSLVGLQRIAHRRRRPPRQAARFQIPPGSVILTLSDDSDKGEGMAVSAAEIEPIVKNFDTLKLGEKEAKEKQPITTQSTNLVNVEVQTEISIAPHSFIEQSMLDMVLKRAHNVAAKQKNQLAICESSLQILGKANVSSVSSPRAFEHPTISMEAIPPMPKKSDPTQKIYDQSYEVVGSTNVTSCLPFPDATKLIFGQTYEVVTHEAVAPSSVTPSFPSKPHCPPAKNTRSKSKKVHWGDL